MGYINSGNLLETLPEVKAADKRLAALKDSLDLVYNKRATEIETKFKSYQQQISNGELSAIQAGEKEKELQADQQELRTLAEQFQFRMVQEREKRIQPILAKVDEAIYEIGKEHGYLFIFDESQGGLLYNQKGDDIAPLVRKKLGIN